jgi:formamidopyrimidine-DNA glycosylase
MPELPEVETLRRQLERDVVGATIRRVTVRWRKTIGRGGTIPTPFPQAVRGARIEAIGRRGKNLLVHLDGGRSIVAQMRMTGQLLRTPRSARPDRHTHLIFHLEGARDGCDLHLRDIRKFARFFLTRTARLDELPALAGLGPEPLEIDRKTFAAVLAGRATRVKPLLLNQRRIAGLGNIYVDEALFAARLHPLTPAGRIAPQAIGALHQAIQRILRASIRTGGTTMRNFRNIAGEKGRYRERLKVYQRTGQPCARCNSPIERIVVSGRGTHFCPKCQTSPQAPA